VESEVRLQEIRPEEVRAHLERVLSSLPFRASKRCSRFLAYVVSEALEGNTGHLKERILATEVFDRSASFDPGDDTIVRVGAREVRKRLAQYYASRDGMHEKIRIELPSGSYLPEFVAQEAAHAGIAAAGTETVPRPGENGSWKLRSRAFVAIAIIVCAAAVLIQLTFGLARKSAFDEFWAGMWQPRNPVLIAMAHPLVYHLSSRVTRLNAAKLGPAALSGQRPLELPSEEINGSDIIPVPDQYVGYGDSVTATQIAVLLAKHSVGVRLHPGNKLEFEDFREAPAVLIGAFTNRWTLEFTQNLRFHFGFDHGAPAILDAAGSGRCWSIPMKQENGASSEDYFLVARLLSSASGKPMMIAAGLAQFGTEAAGRFLVDNKQLEETLKKVGADWRGRNLLMVFHAKVIGNAPSASELVAWSVS
jgi:hypothetical protein